MRKILTLIMAGTMGTAVAGSTNQELLERLDALQSQVMEQQAEINSLKARMGDAELSQMVRSEVDSAIDARSLAQVREVGPVAAFRPHLEGIQFTGELEMGYLRERFKPEGEPRFNASAFYTKFRVGALWQTNEGWEIGAGLVTGLAQDRLMLDDVFGFDIDLQNPRDRRNVWSRQRPFESGSIALDYAYARHSWDLFSLTVGQHFNPFRTSYVLWDEDVRPVGVTAQAEFEGLFATLGWYNVLNRGLVDDRDVQMYAGQIGYGMDLETFDFTVAAAYYRTTSNLGRIIMQDRDYKLNTADLFVEVGTHIENIRLAAQGQVWRNLSARRGADSQSGIGLDPKDNDTGFMVGLIGEFAGLRGGYAYTRVEADSFGEPVIDEFTYINSWGHKFSLGYDITDHMGVNGTYRRLKQIRGGEDKADIYEVDLSYRF